MVELKPIAVLVRNERGVLARVAGLFARRGFNITSLAVGETEDPRFSRITVVVACDDVIMEQVVKQLNRLVSVIKVMDLTKSSRVERGLALVKVRVKPEERAGILELVDIFRARVDHVDHKSMVVEVTGERNKVQALIDMLKPHGILEMARTGQIALGRSETIYQVPGAEAPDEGADSGVYNLYKLEQGEQ
jgi:acetolactate synthase-1/3 small subunit